MKGQLDRDPLPPLSMGQLKTTGSPGTEGWWKEKAGHRRRSDSAQPSSSAAGVAAASAHRERSKHRPENCRDSTPFCAPDYSPEQNSTGDPPLHHKLTAPRHSRW
jgi:hypothetical protein